MLGFALTLVSEGGREMASVVFAWLAEDIISSVGGWDAAGLRDTLLICWGETTLAHTLRRMEN